MAERVSITVKHDWAMAHRLTSDMSPKCQQIHGHNWICLLTVSGPTDENDMIVEFGELKRTLRLFLDGEWDHKTMLNEKDRLRDLITILPGFFFVPFEPTTENIAKAIWEEMSGGLPVEFKVRVDLWETERNMASYGE